MQEEEYSKINTLILSPQQENMLLAFALLKSLLNKSTEESLKYIINVKINELPLSKWSYKPSIIFNFGRVQLCYNISESLIRYYIGHTEGYEYKFYCDLIVDGKTEKTKELILTESWLIYNDNDESKDAMFIRLKEKISEHAFTILSEFLLTK